MAWLGHPDCKATWEPASILSSSLVADYEAGIQKETITESATTYGHISSTLVTKNNSSPEPPAKKPKVQDSNEQNEQRLVSILLTILLRAHGVLHYWLIDNEAPLLLCPGCLTAYMYLLVGNCLAINIYRKLP